MGKTTVVIDEKLLEEAVRAARVRTKREAIEAGLRELVRGSAREALRKELGTFELDLTLKELKRLRHAR
jgi:Arc/MetJ family transcription regulator